MTDAALLECVAEIGRRLSQGGAAELAGVITKSGSPEKLALRRDGLSTVPQQKLAAELIAAWRTTDVDGAALAAALQAAQLAAELERTSETVDLIWTGPKTTQVPLAKNAEALNEIVDSATDRLLVVSYATYDVPKLIERVTTAVERGVSVDIVLEFHGSDADQPQTYDPVKGLGGSLPASARVWEWPVELRTQNEKGKVGYIHVKCAVADGRDAFVSSANLTVYAMEMNMELGVMIRGGEVPDRIARHFASLIDEGILQEVEL